MRRRTLLTGIGTADACAALALCAAPSGQAVEAGHHLVPDGYYVDTASPPISTATTSRIAPLRSAGAR